MGRYVVMRLVGLVGVMLAVSLVTFVLMHSVPGGPFDTKMGDKPMPQAIKDQINKLYGLDRPLYEQYFVFIKNAVRLDFGTSYIYINRKVTDIYLERWPYTIKLAVLTLIFGGAAGLGLGIVAAVKQNTWADYVSTFITMFCIVMPTFVLAVLPAVRLRGQAWLAAHRRLGHVKQWILPVVCNSIIPIAVLQRFVRSSMVDAMGSNYVRTARAKGVNERGVMLVHVFKNALSPMITVGGPDGCRPAHRLLFCRDHVPHPRRRLPIGLGHPAARLHHDHGHHAHLDRFYQPDLCAHRHRLRVGGPARDVCGGEVTWPSMPRSPARPSR
jgi:ABC-type dipeptide/oligopeptide/nickel transport system permease component